MSKYKQIDVTGVKTITIKGRKSKVTPKDFAKPLHCKACKLQKLVDSLPLSLLPKNCGIWWMILFRSHNKKKPVILMMEHTSLRSDVSSLIVDLLNRGYLSPCSHAIARLSIHDCWTQQCGEKLLKMLRLNLLDEHFGMSKETGDVHQPCAHERMTESDAGNGEIPRKKIIAMRAKNKSLSILACATNLVSR